MRAAGSARRPPKRSAAAGAHVILVARTASALEAVDDRIHEAGGTATIAPLDLTEGESIGKLAAAIAERWEALDILVLNAAMLGSLTPGRAYRRQGIWPDPRHQPARQPGDHRRVRPDAAPLRSAPRSSRLTSSVGSEPRAFWGAYGSSKAALETLLGAYADETQHSGRIRVHIVDPGATRTRMRQLAFPGEEPASLKPPEAVATAILERLQSDAATGERMRVDG